MDRQYMVKVPDLRKKFLEKHYSADKNYYDTRDISRIKSDDIFVLQYLNARNGNVDKAYKIMDEAMKWRNSFGVNGITEKDIDEEILNSGVLLSHGKDKKGSNMLLFEGKKYVWKKDKQKTASYRKFVVYHFEKQQRENPGEKISLVSDCDGISIKDHDTENDQFFSRMLTKYYPDILQNNYILHFPPIFQALWKAAKVVLGDAITKKYVFPKDDEVFNYIDRDQLPVSMGGECLVGSATKD